MGCIMCLNIANTQHLYGALSSIYTEAYCTLSYSSEQLATYLSDLRLETKQCQCEQEVTP